MRRRCCLTSARSRCSAGQAQQPLPGPSRPCASFTGQRSGLAAEAVSLSVAGLPVRLTLQMPRVGVHCKQLHR